MICNFCGTNNSDGAIMCSNCGASLNNVNPNSQQGQNIPYVQQPMYNNAYATINNNDKKSVGLNILAFFIPLVGLILWACNKSSKPIQSKSVGKSALAGFITSLVISVITVVASFALLGGIFSTIDEYGDFEVEYNESYEYTEDDYNLSTQDEQDNSGDAVNNNALDWNNIIVNVNGADVELPCSYSEFVSKTGVSLEDISEAELMLNPNSYTFTLDGANSNGAAMNIRLFNNTDTPLKYKECMVVGIKVDDWDDNYVSLVFPNNIKLGDVYSRSELLSVFGEAYDVYESDDTEYEIITWEDENNFYNEFEIVSGDGERITEISLDAYPKD